MPIVLTPVNYSPLHNEVELVINDEDALAEQIAYLMLGKYLHVLEILASKNTKSTVSPDKAIEEVIIKLSNVKEDVDRHKRDGWVFQMITWYAIHHENIGKKFKAQIPHDELAQHGIDGLSVLFKDDDSIDRIYICEDKYTENPRNALKNKVWAEFKDFENGVFDSKLVNRVSKLIEHLSASQIYAATNKDIYKNDIRTYRVGITPKNDDNKTKKRLKLFKGYDGCVSGPDHQRRNAITFYQPSIRVWMDSFANKVISCLISQKGRYV